MSEDQPSVEATRGTRPTVQEVSEPEGPDFTVPVETELVVPSEPGRARHHGANGRSWPIGDQETYEWIPPVETELTVLTARAPSNRKINWTVRELRGTDIFRPPKDAVWPPTNMGEVDAIQVDSNLITTKDGLVDGEELLVHDLFGFCIAVVTEYKDGSQRLLNPNGKMVYFTDFVDDRGEGEPPRWVTTGSGSLAALQRLNIYADKKDKT